MTPTIGALPEDWDDPMTTPDTPAGDAALLAEIERLRSCYDGADNLAFERLKRAQAAEDALAEARAERDALRAAGVFLAVAAVDASNRANEIDAQRLLRAATEWDAALRAAPPAAPDGAAAAA